MRRSTRCSRCRGLDGFEFAAVRDRAARTLGPPPARFSVGWRRFSPCFSKSRSPCGEAARRHADAVADIEAQLRVVAQGFVALTGATHLADLTRYLTAIVRRLEKLPQGLVGDRGADEPGACGSGRLR